jgi:hypothetical protein
MIYADWMIFLLKLLLVPTFTAIVSFSSRKWGPIVGGWLIGLPLTSGPVALFLALEQGNVFASAASSAIMMGIISVFMFALAYATTAMRFLWRLSLLAGLCAYFACTFFLESVRLPLPFGFVMVLGVLVITLLLMPHAGSEKVLFTTRRWEIPARMGSATVLVFFITGVAQWFGPQLTGLLTPFPVYATILAVFTHRSQGGAPAISLLRGVVAGSFTFTTFFLVISATIINWGVGLAFVSAILIGIVTHAISFQFLKRETRD